MKCSPLRFRGRQQKQIEALAATVQKVSARLEMNNSASQIVKDH
jgi:hypothetical protein